jgi:hypothetical protein
MAEVIRPTRLMAAPEPAKVEPVEVPGINALLTLAVAVVVVAGLYFGRTMLVPITLAVLLSFLLAPLASALRRLRLGRTISVLLAVLLALTVLLGVTGTIGVQIADLTTDLPRYQAVLQTKVTTIRTATVERLAALENHLGSDHGAARPATARPLTHVPQGTASNPMTVEVQTPPPSPLDMVRRIAGPVLEPLGTIALVLLISIFIMLQKEDLRDRLIRLFGSSDLHRTTPDRAAAALRALCGRVYFGLAAGAAGGVRGTGLGSGVLDAGAVPGGRADRWPDDRAIRLWAFDRAFAGFGGGGGAVLDLDLGPGGAVAGNAPDAVPGGAGAAREAAGVFGCAAGRPAGADAGREPVSAHAGQ